MWRNSICFDWRRSHDSISLSSFSRKLAAASWSYSCFSQGRRRSESNTVIFHSNPPLTSRGILERCWKQMVTGSNPARSLGNLHQNLIKIPSCFQAHINLSFRSTPPKGPQIPFFSTSTVGSTEARDEYISDRLGLRILPPYEEFQLRQRSKVQRVLVSPIGIWPKCRWLVQLGWCRNDWG